MAPTPHPPPPLPSEVKNVAIVGTGVIGAGWAALCLAKGLNVKAYVRSERSRAKFSPIFIDAWNILVARGVATGDANDALGLVSFSLSLAGAVADADYIQESIVEDLPLKHSIVSQIDRAAKPGVLIGTSSSFQPFSLIAMRCEVNPMRVVTAHPSLPQWDDFVECVGPTPETTSWLTTFFEDRLDCDVISLSSEHYGHAFNSIFQSCILSSLALSRRGICSAEDVDKASVHLAKCILASDGISKTMVGLVGGGSTEASDEMSAHTIVGMPTASLACAVTRTFGFGSLSKIFLWVTHFLGLILHIPFIKKLVFAGVQWVTTPWNAHVREAIASAGGDKMFRDETIRRIAAVEKIVTRASRKAAQSKVVPKSNKTNRVFQGASPTTKMKDHGHNVSTEANNTTATA